jgi:hypothetical protein
MGMTEGQRVWEAWMAAFSRIHAAWPTTVSVDCPSCGRGKVHVSYTGDPSTRIGYAIAWCDVCLKGIYISRLRIPDGAEMFTFDTPDEEIDAVVPNVSLIQPDPWLDEDE